MENLRMEHHHGGLLSDPFLYRTSSPVCDHVPPLSSPSPPPEQAGSFSSPLLRSSPLSCKLEPQESPPLEFVSLCLSRDEPASNIQEAIAAVKDRMHTLSLNGSSKGVFSCEEVTIASLEDGSSGLKLRKRFYCEDAAGDAAPKQAENSSGSSKSSSSSNNNITRNNGIQRKKHKGSTSSYVTPRCQVEGCHVDLSGSKDYHRRHKVCELHSKASVCNVAGCEQRFCQQCSRFHLLSEFNEGRRSCRRRLAGHNERRRKPPQEPIPLLAADTLAYLADGRFNTLLMESMQRGETIMGSSSVVNTSLAPKWCLTGLLPEEDVGSNYQVSESDHIMQGLPMGGGLLDAGRALIAASGNRLLPSRSLGPPLAISPASLSMTLALNSQPSSEMAFSGCALSLLSSLGIPNNPCTMSMPFGTTYSPADQLLVDAHMLTLPRVSSSCFSTGMGVLSAPTGLSANLNEGFYPLTNASIGYLAGIGIPQSSLSFEGASMLPESDFQTLQSGGNYVRPILDFMQMASLDSQQQVTQTGLHGLSIFNRQTTT